MHNSNMLKHCLANLFFEYLLLGIWVNRINSCENRQNVHLKIDFFSDLIAIFGSLKLGLTLIQ